MKCLYAMKSVYIYSLQNHVRGVVHRVCVLISLLLCLSFVSALIQRRTVQIKTWQQRQVLSEAICQPTFSP